MGAVAGLFAGAASAVDPAAQRRGDPAAAAQKADVFLAINASTIELADLGECPWSSGRLLPLCRRLQAAAEGAARRGAVRWTPELRLLELAAAGAAAAHSIPSYPALPCLPPAETYVNETVGARPVVTWNMELDTLRSDLGACLQRAGAWVGAACCMRGRAETRCGALSFAGGWRSCSRPRRSLAPDCRSATPPTCVPARQACWASLPRTCSTASSAASSPSSTSASATTPRWVAAGGCRILQPSMMPPTPAPPDAPPARCVSWPVHRPASVHLVSICLAVGGGRPLLINLQLPASLSPPPYSCHISTAPMPTTGSRWRRPPSSATTAPRLPLTAAAFSTTLNPPLPVGGGGPLHHQLQRRALPRVPRALAGARAGGAGGAGRGCVGCAVPAGLQRGTRCCPASTRGPGRRALAGPAGLAAGLGVAALVAGCRVACEGGHTALPRVPGALAGARRPAGLQQQSRRGHVRLHVGAYRGSQAGRPGRLPVAAA